MNALKKEIADADFIGKLIPQKPPFVMVDKLLAFEEKKVVSGLRILEDNILVENGRFSAPGLIEHMAQSVALYTGYKYFLKDEVTPVGYIGSIKKAEIFELPNIDSELISEVAILHEIMNVTMVSVETKCDGKTIALCEMKTVLAG